MNIIGPSLQREAECEQVLRSLPQWFGIEEALLTYARDSATLPTFAIESEARIIGFVSLQQHFPMSWEVHCIAISADARSAGLGTRLLEHAEQWLSRGGARFVQIKTIAAGSPSPEYADSRAFYAARGYLPLEVFPTLWSERNPALQLVKSLPAGADEAWDRLEVKDTASWCCGSSRTSRLGLQPWGGEVRKRWPGKPRHGIRSVAFTPFINHHRGVRK